MQEIDYRRAMRRIEQLGVAIAAGGSVAAAVHYGAAHAVGFAAGAVLAFVSFFFIRRIVEGLRAGTAEEKPPPSARSMALGVAARYAIISAVVFAIMKVTGTSAWPVFAGLMTIVAAVIAEILYELVTLARS